MASGLSPPSNTTHLQQKGGLFLFLLLHESMKIISKRLLSNQYAESYVSVINVTMNRINHLRFPSSLDDWCTGSFMFPSQVASGFVWHLTKTNQNYDSLVLWFRIFVDFWTSVPSSGHFGWSCVRDVWKSDKPVNTFNYLILIFSQLLINNVINNQNDFV